MKDADEQHNFATEGVGATSSSALKSASSYLAASESSGDSCNGCREQFSASFSALLTWGEAQGFIKQESDFPFLKETPTAAGHEHEVWFNEDSNRWFKVTYCNRFGLAWGRVGSATPKEYFERLILQNGCFGDDIRLEALINCGQKLRILTSQPHIQGEPAPANLIKEWFELMKFKRLESGGSIAWYQPEYNLLIADAHEGNVILTCENYLVPIDLNLTEPTDSMRVEILRMIASSEC